MGFSAWPTFCETRAAIGTAETPAEPIRGLTLPPVSRYISFPSSTPPAVPSAERAQAHGHDGQRLGVEERLGRRRRADGDAQEDRDDVASARCEAVLTRRSTTPDSLSRLPSISMAIRGAAEGSRSETNTVTMIGKQTFSVLETGAQLGHDDLALLLGGQQLHDGRLDDGHQRHVGIRRNRDRPQQLRRQLGGDEDGGRAVRAADDADGGRLLPASCRRSRRQRTR